MPTYVKGRHTADIYLFSVLTVDGRKAEAKVSFPIKHQPLFADHANGSIVVLVTQENWKRPLAVRDDFYPFDLTEDEKRRVRQAIAGRSAASGQAR